MKIGVYPFASGGSVADNLCHIERAIAEAAERGVRVLALHECALCGYPPIETDLASIREAEIASALRRISARAKESRMVVAVGTVRFDGERRYNAVIVVGADGEILGCYDKRALWGWDADNFTRGKTLGVFEVDGVKLAFRICFDVRFPEPFRELYRAGVELCFVAFSDTAETEQPVRYDTIKAHLVTRAMENIMTVVSVNSLSRFQTAPTAVFDCNGVVLQEAEAEKEALLVYDYVRPQVSFGTRGRYVNNDYFLEIGENP